MTFETFIRRLIDRKIIPGVSLLIARGETVILKKHYGCKSLEPAKEPLNEDTIYDTASLTKPLISALAAVYLIEKNELALHTGIKKIFPGLDFDINIFQLLTHTSGLPAWFPFYLYDRDYLQLFKRLKLEAKPGRKVNYSCVGYILLYFLIEKVTGVGFKDFVRQIILNPLKLEHTCLGEPGELIKGAAPTEKGNNYEKKMAENAKEHAAAAGTFNWRESMIQGETHDCNSFYLGGTAGNAGLFSTTGDLFRLALEFFPGTATLLNPGSIELFWKNFTPLKKSHRTIGFKLNSSFITSGGRALSRGAVGHTGFTGTSLWLDPVDETKYIILTNRIHPQVSPFNFNRARRKLHYLIKGDNVPGEPAPPDA